MLKRFGMEECAPISTPMIVGCKLSKDDESLEVNSRLHKSMIGSLLYLTALRPHIMETIGMAAKFQSTSKESHMQVVKRIFPYLKGHT